MHALNHFVLFILGADGRGSKGGVIKQWMLSHGLKILIYLVAYVIIIFVVRYLTRRFLRKVEDKDSTTRSERERRADTFADVINATSMIFFGMIVLLMILRELNVAITPLLTGAGILGVGFGFAAQSILKDFLHGFFILAENQIRVGDVVEIAGHAGLVEGITMRTVRLRSLDGHVHIVPNGEIRTVENMTHEWSRALVDIEVAYKEDLDRVIAVVTDEAEKFVKDEKYKGEVRGKPEILGVDSLGSSGITIRFMIKTRPLKQWEIKRELYRRLKKRFDQEGISIPFPQLRLHGEITARQS
jgi:small-conductance mechanosensitive channel